MTFVFVFRVRTFDGYNFFFFVFVDGEFEVGILDFAGSAKTKAPSCSTCVMVSKMDDSMELVGRFGDFSGREKI